MVNVDFCLLGKIERSDNHGPILLHGNYRLQLSSGCREPSVGSLIQNVSSPIFLTTYYLLFICHTCQLHSVITHTWPLQSFEFQTLCHTQVPEIVSAKCKLVQPQVGLQPTFQFVPLTGLADRKTGVPLPLSLDQTTPITLNTLFLDQTSEFQNKICLLR